VLKAIDIFCSRCGEGLDGNIEIDAENDTIIIRVQACPPCLRKAKRLDDVIESLENAELYGGDDHQLLCEAYREKIKLVLQIAKGGA